LRVIPEVGKVPEYTSKCPQDRSGSGGCAFSQASRAVFHVAISFGTVGSSDVFPHNPGGPVEVDGFAHLHPQVRAGALGHAGAATGVGEVLAGGAAGDDVRGFDGRPVDPGHISQVGDVRVVVGEDPGRRRGVFAERDGAGTEDVLDGHAEPVVPGAQFEGGELPLRHWPFSFSGGEAGAGSRRMRFVVSAPY
jgi:hypothetical protein